MNLLSDDTQLSKDSHLQMKPAFLSLLLVIRSSPSVACMALQKNSAQLRPQIRYLWTSLPSKSPQIRYSGTKIGRILGPRIRYFWTRNGLSFPGPTRTDLRRGERASAFCAKFYAYSNLSMFIIALRLNSTVSPWLTRTRVAA